MWLVAHVTVHTPAGIVIRLAVSFLLILLAILTPLDMESVDDEPRPTLCVLMDVNPQRYGCFENSTGSTLVVTDIVRVEGRRRRRTEEDMEYVDKAVVVAEVVSSSASRLSAELRPVDMAVTSVSRCVMVVMLLLLLLLLLLLFPSHSMFWAAAVATVVQLSTSSSRAFFANHPSSVSFAFCFGIGDPDVRARVLSILLVFSKSTTLYITMAFSRTCWP